MQPDQALPDPEEKPGVTSFDVVIIGGGPVGLLLANLFGHWGVKTLLCERNADTSSSPKAIFIDDEFMRTLDRVGLAEEFRQQSFGPVGNYYYSSFLRRALVKVEGVITPNAYPNRSAMVQPEFERLLRRGAARFPCVTLSFSTELLGFSQQDEKVHLQLQAKAGDKSLASCRFLFAADGAHSTVRKALGIAFDGQKLPLPHVVVDVESYADQSPFTKYYCDPQRPWNSIPSPFGGRRFEFRLLPTDDPAKVVTPEGVRALFPAYFQPPPFKIVRSAIYEYSERLAASFSSGNIFLIGDAAHLMPPQGAQGLNSGARDALNCAWKVWLVLNAKAAPSLLATYDLERREHIQAIIRYSVRISRIVNISSPTTAFVRDLAFALLALIPSARRYFAMQRHLPKPFLARGMVVHTEEPTQTSVVGRLLPQPRVMCADGSKVLLDQVLGEQFSLVVLGSDGQSSNALSEHEIVRRMAIPTVHVLSADSPVKSFRGAVRLLEPGSGSFRPGQRLAYLVRPDRYVAAVVDLSSPDTSLRAALEPYVPNSL